MGEKYLGNVAEVAALNGVRNFIVESTTNGIKKIPINIFKKGIYKDLPIDSALSDTSENAVKNKVIKSALDAKANSIISTSSGTVFHETDCAAVPPINIKLFGKGKQDGTPSMETPIEVVSHGESGSIGGKVLTGNLLELTEDMMWKCELLDANTGSIRLNYDNNYSTLVAKPFLHKILLNNHGTPFSFICDNLPSNYHMGIVVYGERKNGGTYQETRSAIGKFATIITTDFYSINRIELRIGSFASGTSDTTTIINGLRFCIDDKEIPFSPYTEQPFTVLTPNGLRGIPLGQTIPDAIKNSPIHMNGVYWDNAEGQYYIGDTKNENGKDVQRIFKYTLTEEDRGYIYKVESSAGNTFNFGGATVNKLPPIINCNDCAITISSVATGIASNNRGNKDFVSIYITDGSAVYIRDSLKNTLTIEEVRNADITIWFVLAEPIITDTTKEEKAQLDALVMNYPNTTIVNDAGAYQEVTYIADTKNYIAKIEKKHEEDIQTLKNAILSLGGNI